MRKTYLSIFCKQMKRGSIVWKKANKSDTDQVIPVAFLYDEELQEDVVYWSLEALVSGFIYAKRAIQKLHNYVSKEMTAIRTAIVDDHLMIHQFDLSLVFDELAERGMLPKDVRDTIMNFLEEVPTPTYKQQSYISKAKDKGKEEEAPFYSVSSSEEEEEEKRGKRKRSSKEEQEEEEESSSSEDEDFQDVIDQVLVTTRLIDTLLPVLDRQDQDIFSDYREKSHIRLFIKNLIRSLPQNKVLRMCADPAERQEPEDDSPVISVSQRVTDLGYALDPSHTSSGQRQRMDIGMLAHKYYRELNDGRSPPQIYRTFNGGTRVLVTKWTLNNCRNTLDRAIHTIMQ